MQRRRRRVPADGDISSMLRPMADDDGSDCKSGKRGKRRYAEKETNIKEERMVWKRRRTIQTFPLWALGALDF